ncbi:uncharacterized protein BT62DRAFT_924851 [Guyanagaster necrorhizus]|uniref:F-box domain-containing protein n=1 Tax=Guyanagaster necrorhizus TaxID=856835 RepID=A0A9P7VFU4_9AGAR|nr:uncharacterized protein BT62DRAFT_924851 [Guyanagaster necrorhizus MCA 3950]KAG7439214.1 hypothetical protein BT62DRAFT_924851 [Guyanagaster necrorhizus MCA 3950]
MIHFSGMISTANSTFEWELERIVLSRPWTEQEDESTTDVAPVKPQLEIVTCARGGIEFKVELLPENAVVFSLYFNLHLVAFMAIRSPLKLIATPRIHILEPSFLEIRTNGNNMNTVSPTAITTLRPQFINDLPVELLYEIFLWAIQDDSAVDTRVIQSPWTLSHVCRRWRHIAISFPCLWSTIHVGSTRQSLHNSFSMNNIEGLGTVLRRSGTTALMLRVEFTDRKLPAGHSHIRDLLKSLASVSRRWKSIKMKASISIFHELFERVILGALPLLQSIHFEVTPNCYWGATPMAASLTATLEMAPNLRSVTLLPFIPIRLPLSRLKELTTKDLTQNELSSIIQELPHLEILNFVGLRAWHAIGWTPPLHVHSSLHKIEIEGIQELSHFTLPALTHLRLLKPFCSSPQSRDWRTNFSLDILKRFLLRSGCSIRHLHLSIHEVGPDVTGILSLLVDATGLRVDVGNHSVYGDLLKMLRSREALLLPKLDTLEFFGVEMSERHLETILALVQYRRNHPVLQRIKSVVVEKSSFVNGQSRLDKTIGQLREVEDDDFKLVRDKALQR